jgi:hypothetical protein
VRFFAAVDFPLAIVTSWLVMQVVVSNHDVGQDQSQRERGELETALSQGQGTTRVDAGQSDEERPRRIEMRVRHIVTIPPPPPQLRLTSTAVARVQRHDRLVEVSTGMGTSFVKIYTSCIPVPQPTELRPSLPCSTPSLRTQHGFFNDIISLCCRNHGCWCHLPGFEGSRSK